MHWTQLKKAVEAAGGTYESKDQAEAFLSSVGVDTSDKVLDRARPFSVVCGEDPRWPGAKFGQDGMYFNAKGDKVG